MIIKIKTSADLPYSAVTPEQVYQSRRDFLRTTTGVLGVAAGAAVGGFRSVHAQSPALAPLTAPRNAALSASDKLNTYADITTYNNYYEFGTEKTDPSRYAGEMKVKPWSVRVDGLVGKPGNYGVEDLVNFNALEERVYRHRCVERWSVVIPWIGVSLSDVLKKVEPQPGAKFVEFTTLDRPAEMRGLRSSAGNLEYPYVEGLTMAEAMHPLTMMVVGLYGKVLPNQNGAPLRVHIPWKYGFKSGKSIVRIRFAATQPKTTWNIAASNEYGFYANVNPNKPHPRWSQAREQRLPSPLMNTPTQLFNGYADQVASLYSGAGLEQELLMRGLWRATGRAIDAVAGSRLFKPAVFTACLVPGLIRGYQLYQIFLGDDPRALGPDPTKALEHATGRYALTLLFLTLMVTPLRRSFEANRLQRVRRMLGVWSFSYTLVHLSAYVTLNQLCYSWSTCQFHDMWVDLSSRKFIFVGMTAWSLLLLLAITSTTGWVRRLKRNWQRLHRLVYPAAILAVVHFAWGQKSDIREPLEWGAFLTMLLGYRVWIAWQKRAARPRKAVSA